MDASWKENMPPWPGGHLKPGGRLVQKNVNIGLSVGSRQGTRMSCRTEIKRTSPAILPSLGPGCRLELGRPVVQTNLGPAGQPLPDAMSLVSNYGFEQQSNLQPRAWRPRASGKWRGFFQQRNMTLGRADPERRGEDRSPQPLEEPGGNLTGCSWELLCPWHSGSAPSPSRPNSQTHGHSWAPRDQTSSSFSGLGNSVQVSTKATKAQAFELSSPPQSRPQGCPVQPSPRLQGTSGCWTPDPMGQPLSSEDLDLSGWCQRSAYPWALRPRAELSPESPSLLLSTRCLEWPAKPLLLRASQDYPRPWPHSNWATSPEASLTSTPEHPSSLTHPCRAVPPEATSHLTPEHPSSLTHPCRAVPPEATSHLTPEHPRSLTHRYRAVPPEATSHLTPEHPRSLTHRYRAVPPEATSHLIPEHPRSFTHPCRAVPPEAIPHLTLEHPSPLTHPCRAVPSETTPHLTPQHPSPLTLSHITMNPVISPDLTAEHPSPLTLSHSTVSPVISPDLTAEHPSPLTLSHSTVSPVVTPDLTPKYPSPLSFPHGPVNPEVSLSMTPGYPKLHPVSIITLAPEASPSLTLGYSRPLILSHRAGTPEASPSQIPGYPNSSGPPSQVGFPKLKLGPPNPLPFSGSTWTPGNPTSSTVSHSPLTPDPSPSFPPLSHNGITLGAPPNLTLGYSSPHTLSDKTTTTKTSPKLPPESSSFHPHLSKTKVPEVTTNLMPGYASPLTSSHRDVTPEISPSLGCPQGMQQLTRAFGLPKTQGWGLDSGTKELGDFRLPSCDDGHGGSTPSFSPGTSGVNVFRAPFPQPHTAPCSAAFSQAFCDKLSLPSGRDTALGDPHQAVPISPEMSSLPMSVMLAHASGSQVNGGQGLMDPQMEGHLQQIWEMPMSMGPQGTNTPLPGPQEAAIPTHWGSPEEGTSSGSGGGCRQNLLKNTASGPYLSGQEGRLGSRTYFSASSSIGMHLLAQQQLRVAHRPNEQEGPWMEQSIAGNLGAGGQNRSELHLAVGASQQELEMGEESPSMEPLTPEARESRALLTRCFKAWRCHLLRQRAVARALRRRHLLRKGIRAMRWSLWLREAQAEYVERKQGRAVLARSFRKWKDIYLNRREKKLLTQSRTETPGKDLLPSQEGRQERSFVTLGVVCGVEGAPKIQLHPRWKSSIQDLRAPASRDLQRLAASSYTSQAALFLPSPYWDPAAFHLWYLQKVLVAEIRQEAQARAELRKKKLRRVFQAWWARTMNAAQIFPLVTRHQRAQLGRCFGAWRLHMQRKTWCQGRLAHWRVETLRKSLQQWVKMVRLRATHSRTVTQLYLHRQRCWHLEVSVAHEGPSRGPISQGPGEQIQLCYRPEVRAKDSVEEACRRLELHRVILLWSRRLTQHQWADSFSWRWKLRLLQNTLQRWRQKAQEAESPSAHSTNSPLEAFVGSQDSEEPPASSGFLSSALAPLGPSTPRSSSEKVHRPTESSSSLILAGDHVPCVLPLGLSSLSKEAPEAWRISFPLGQKWPQHWEWGQLLAYPSPGEETGPWREAIQVPRDPDHLDTPWPEAGWQQRSQRALEAKQHGQITFQSCHFQAWHHLVLTALNLWVRLWTLQVIQRRTLVDLANMTNPWGQDWRTSGSQLYCARQHCLLRPPWAHWNTELPRERPRLQMTKEEEGTSASPRARTNAMHPSRPAIRGHHIMCVYPDALGKQAGNYWTRATALVQAKRKPHSHMRQRKTSVSLGGPKRSFLLLSFPCLPLLCSSFQLWLQLYQRQSRAKGLTSQERSTRQEEGGSCRTIQMPKSRDPWKAALLEETWLKRKYLQKWRHEVLLLRFHSRQRKKRLAEVWQCWMEAQGLEQLSRTLVRQRWLEWAWGMWRRRWLQLQVALCLQEDHRVLSQVSMITRPLEDGTSTGQPGAQERKYQPVITGQYVSF